jgi:hypothetical protein
MPNKKRPLNLEIVRSNLAEAIEEPQKLERRAETGDLHEEGLQVGLCLPCSSSSSEVGRRRISCRCEMARPISATTDGNPA